MTATSRGRVSRWYERLTERRLMRECLYAWTIDRRDGLTLRLRAIRFSQCAADLRLGLWTRKQRSVELLGLIELSEVVSGDCPLVQGSPLVGEVANTGFCRAMEIA